jgi:hypothetical protein
MTDPVDPIDGGERPTPPRRGHDDEANELAAPDQPVGDFGDEERADPGGDSDVEGDLPGR